jgi:uncharacterized protein involved in outer membrane biogenesis
MIFFYIMKKGTKIAFIVLGALVLILSISIALLIKYANTIIKHELESLLGKDFSVRRIDLHWGRVEAFDISFRNPAGKTVLKSERLVLKADFIGILRKKYIISNLSLQDPYLFLEKDMRGNLIYPLPQRRTIKEETKKSATPVIIKKINLKDGSLDYLDRKVSPPVLTKLRDIDLELKDISFPLEDNFSTYILSASIPGNQSTGMLKSNGKIKSKTKDTDCKVELRRLDITGFKPYYQKKSDVNLKKGNFDLDMDVKIKSRKINAPGRAVLRDLDFESSSGIGNTFLSIPRSAVINFLKNNNNEIAFNFELEGDLDNPKFNIRESFMETVSIAIAGKLGLSVKRIGESIVIFGAEGAKEVGKGVKGIGESIKKIFE